MRNRGNGEACGGLGLAGLLWALVAGCATGLPAEQEPDAAVTPDTAAAVCGNGLVEGGEDCDDGNQTPWDGCSDSCRLELCDAETCPGGCCDAAGRCWPGNESKTCGGGGESCDDCTVGARRCEDQVCVEVTECEPGEQQPCDDCGVRYCDVTGHWGPCLNEGCPPGTSEQGGSCGSCGVLERTCDQLCEWGGWVCVNEGVCTSGDVEVGTTCGNGGHEERLCDSACQWGGWTCEGEGVCVNGIVETGGACGNCGQLERTCTGGAWGAWVCAGQGVCVANDSQVGSACGNCGAEERTCDPNTCQWSAWTCAGEGVCVAGSTQTGTSCQGGTEERTCDSQTCQWGPWVCNGGCPVAGHLGTGENGDLCDQASQDERWRCVFSSTLNTWVSQVCRDFYQPNVEWVWVNYAMNPADCSACCDTYTSDCT